MKRYNKIAGILMIGVLFLAGCNDDSAPKSTEKWVTTHTIAKFISDYSSDIGDLPTRIPSLFSVDTIPSNTDIVINGIVTSMDDEGNIYKNLVIQDTVSKRALKISVDAGNLSAIFPVGRAISIKCNGLAIGKYAQMLQLGTPFYNTTSGKTGFEIGRIPYAIFMSRVQISDAPAISMSAIVDTVTIAQILSSGPEMHAKIVCIKNAYFTGKGADYGAPVTIAAAEQIFAPSTNGIGFPQAREIKDATGSIFIATSEYSKFANLKLPAATISGNITAIVGWYNDKDVVQSSSKIYHQLTLRSIKDLGKGFESYQLGLINN